MSKPELDQSDRWKQVEEELQEWGSKLEEIRANANDVGKDVIVDLEARYNSVLREVKELKVGTEPVLQSSRDKTASLADNLKEKAQAGLDTANEKLTAAREAAGETTAKLSEQTQKTTEQIKESAGDIGEGFQKAWEELRQAFDKAYRRIKK